jgi:uncharacterized protein (TIGR03437 family)
MRKVCLCTLALLAALSPLTAKPRIDESSGARSRATVADPTLLAQGSAFEITGAALGPAEAAAAEVPYPQELAGVTVTLKATSDGATFSAYLISAAADRIIAIVPSAAPPGAYTITTSYAGESSNAFNIAIADTNFGLVTNTGAIGGMTQARIVAPGAEPVAATFVNPATPGSTVEFSAAGLGTTGEADNEFPAEVNRVDGAVLVIGGQEVPITYIGRDPARPGYDKVIVTLPAENLPLDCSAFFQIRLPYATTTTFSLPTAAEPGAPCQNSLGISPEGLHSLSQGGGVVRGGMTLARVLASVKSGALSYESKSDQFSGGFVAYTARAISDMMARAQIFRDAQGNNTCVVYTPNQGAESGVFVDAGDSLVLTGPAWSVQVPRTQGAPNVYGLILAQSFTGITIPPSPGALNQPFGPGRYKLDGAGGAVVGPFTAEVDVSDQFQWTNGAGLDSVDRTKDLILTWTGGVPGELVQAGATVRGYAPESPATVVNRVFQCYGLAEHGQITVPSSILQQMPIVKTLTPAPGITFSSTLSIAHSSPSNASITFRAPLVAGGSTETAAFVFGYTYARAPVFFP